MSEAARFFQALGDETRLALLAHLRAGERTVGALVSALGCPQPKVSRHLKVLKEAGLVRDRKNGRHVTYELARPSQWDRDSRRWLERLVAGPEEAAVPPERPPRPSRPVARVPSTPARDIETHLL